MNSALAMVVRAALGQTPLGLMPVHVRRGVAQGARWTLYPWTSYWRGTHEPALQEAISGLGNGNINGWACWDLGAHFGLYSVGLALRTGPSGQVAAFEPNPMSFARLARHRQMNRLSWLKIFPAAVSDQSGEAELYTYGNLQSTTTHLPYLGETRTENIGSIAVRTLRLDELVEAGDLRSPQFVKIDVEGHGHRALQGMAATVAAHRPIVIAALHSPEEAAGVAGFLQRLGYTSRQIGGQDDQKPCRPGCDYLFTPLDSVSRSAARDREQVG